MSNAKMETRRWAASAGMLLIVVGLLGYLTYIPVPTANRDIIITVLSVLLGAASAAIPNLFGSSDADKESMTAEIQSLRQEVKTLGAKYATLSEEHDKIVRMLIERHVVEGKGVVAEKLV
jgi:predicted negative regulator of RcsB-dependent stress response